MIEWMYLCHHSSDGVIKYSQQSQTDCPSQLVEQALHFLSSPRQEATEAPFGCFNPPLKFECTITEINGSQDISTGHVTGHVAYIGSFLR